MDSYDVRFGHRSTLFGLAGVLVFLVPIVLWSRDPEGDRTLLIIALVFELGAIYLFVSYLRRAIRRERALVIDDDGVFLGRDDERRPAELQPWSTIDAVVHFDARAPDDDASYRYIGVVRGREIVAFRRIDGWKLNKDKASRAVARFGGGRPFRSLAYRPDPVTAPPLRITP
jgi:hypothetical protein